MIEFIVVSEYISSQSFAAMAKKIQSKDVNQETVDNYAARASNSIQRAIDNISDAANKNLKQAQKDIDFIES